MSQRVVYLDGTFLPEADATVPLLTHALHYGTGVFEGIRAYRDPATGGLSMLRPLEHFERMARNVKFLQMHLPHSPMKLVEIARELIRRNAFSSDVYIRPLAFKSGTTVGVVLPPEQSFAMIAVPFGEYLDARNGIHCGVSTWRRLTDNSIPCQGKICGAYVNSALAAQEARDRGFDEAIFLNEAGCVAEGSAMNIFLVRDGILHTPDVSQGILEGITRDTIITLAADRMGIQTRLRAIDRAELYLCDEAFLCGTAAQVAPVTRIDGRWVGDGRPGVVTLAVRDLYDKLVHGGLPEYERWLVPVPGTGTHRPDREAAATR